jgi:hypothetical protein
MPSAISAGNVLRWVIWSRYSGTLGSPVFSHIVVLWFSPKMSDNSPSNKSNHLFNAHKEEASKVKEMFILENGGNFPTTKRKKSEDDSSYDASTGAFKEDRKKSKKLQPADESVAGLIAEARTRLHYEVSIQRYSLLLAVKLSRKPAVSKHDVGARKPQYQLSFRIADRRESVH